MNVNILERVKGRKKTRLGVDKVNPWSKLRIKLVLKGTGHGLDWDLGLGNKYSDLGHDECIKLGKEKVKPKYHNAIIREIYASFRLINLLQRDMIKT